MVMTIANTASLNSATRVLSLSRTPDTASAFGSFVLRAVDGLVFGHRGCWRKRTAFT
jgi:hypothetical protein